jgi:tetratricopeptide (TPR) repeat protein
MRENHEEETKNNKLLIVESRKQLADVSLKLGRLDEAATMYEKAMQASIELRGEMDRNTLELMDHYGEVLEHQNRFTDAEEIYRTSLSRKMVTLGEAHKSTGKTKILLDVLLGLKNEYEGKYEKAHMLYSEALELSTVILGEKHPDTIRLNCNIASLHAVQNNWEKSE